NGEIPWITPKDLSIQNSKYISSGERNITRLGLKSISNRLLPKGTILLSSRAPIGLISIANNELSTNQGFKNIICKKNEIDNEYLYYLLQIIIPQLEKLGTGTTFKELSKSTLEELKISIESNIIHQQKIASILSALDDKIELNNQINAELEAMAKTLYDYWFVQFEFPLASASSATAASSVTNSGTEALEVPYKSSGGKMVYNEQLKREIPEGWEVKSLYEIADFINGLACQKYRPRNENDDYLPVVKIREMSNGISKDTEKVRIDIPKKNKINDGDVLFSWSATLDIKLWTQGEAALNQHIFKVVS